MKILAIDPGSERSAFVEYDTATSGVMAFGKVANDELLAHLGQVDDVEVVVVEWMKPHGRPTSMQEFETLYWIGRFVQRVRGSHAGDCTELCPGPLVRRLAREDVKYHLTGLRAKVGDANVIAALVDRYGGIGGRSAAVGTKAAPGPLHGVTRDVWQALAVAVTFHEKPEEATA